MATAAASVRVVLVLLAVSAALLQPADAENLPPIEPRICTGRLVYDDTTVWGVPTKAGCPANHAISGLTDISGPRQGPPNYVFIFENCCPLPAPDILLQETVDTPDLCPHGYVATRAEGYYQRHNWSKALKRAKLAGTFQLRCTKINTERYQLGPPVPGWYFGFGSNFWRQKFSIFHSELPSGLRYGIGKRSRYELSNQGCFGSPFGALLTGKTGKRCHELLFRSLQFRGLPGDPPAGTPVPMYPECDYIEDPVSDEPMCKRYGKQ